MPQIPEFQFGLSKDELRTAARALGLDVDVDNGGQLNIDQLRAWKLVRDTHLGDWLSHPGSHAEQMTGQQPQPVVVTKRERSMAKYRR